MDTLSNSLSFWKYSESVFISWSSSWWELEAQLTWESRRHESCFSAPNSETDLYIVFKPTWEFHIIGVIRSALITSGPEAHRPGFWNFRRLHWVEQIIILRMRKLATVWFWRYRKARMKQQITSFRSWFLISDCPGYSQCSHVNKKSKVEALHLIFKFTSHCSGIYANANYHRVPWCLDGDLGDLGIEIIQEWPGKGNRKSITQTWFQVSLS